MNLTFALGAYSEDFPEFGKPVPSGGNTRLRGLGKICAFIRWDQARLGTRRGRSMSGCDVLGVAAPDHAGIGPRLGIESDATPGTREQDNAAEFA